MKIDKSTITLGGFCFFFNISYSLNKFKNTNFVKDIDGLYNQLNKFSVMSIWSTLYPIMGFPGYSDGKVCLQCRRPGFNPGVGKIPWRRKWQSIPVFLPGKSHGWRSLAGYSPWYRKESDTTKQLTHTQPTIIKYTIFQDQL